MADTVTMGQTSEPATPVRRFHEAEVGAVLVVIAFTLAVTANVGGHRTTLIIDDVGQWAAAWFATLACAAAASRATTARATWLLLAVSSFLWGLGEALWCYNALLRNVAVPFPSVADIGFLAAVPFACAALLLYPTGPRRAQHRARGVLDGCIIATSLLFASWATILGPLYRSQHDGLAAQVISLAYPMSDVVIISLVVIVLARSRGHGRVGLGLIMAGVAALAVSDSAFAYLTEVDRYSGTSLLDAGWVVGYLLIGLGAWSAAVSPVVAEADDHETTVNLAAPYVTVLVVLAVMSVQLLRGRPIEPVTWWMAIALIALVLGREALGLEVLMLRRHRQGHLKETADSACIAAPEVEATHSGWSS